MSASKDNEADDNEADEAMKALTRLFLTKNFPKAHFRCCVDGPTELDLFFETIFDETFGHDPNSEYKRWVRRLYRPGLIPRNPRRMKQLVFVVLTPFKGIQGWPKRFLVLSAWGAWAATCRDGLLRLITR
jgi:hypothetical protein